jgi:hypothetical protein
LCVRVLCVTPARFCWRHWRKVRRTTGNGRSPVCVCVRVCMCVFVQELGVWLCTSVTKTITTTIATTTTITTTHIKTRMHIQTQVRQSLSLLESFVDLDTFFGHRCVCVMCIYACLRVCVCVCVRACQSCLSCPPFLPPSFFLSFMPMWVCQGGHARESGRGHEGCAR